MTQTDIEIWELTIPDEVVPCWVFTKKPEICPDSIAKWLVMAELIPREYALCNGCKERWQSYGTITYFRPIGK